MKATKKLILILFILFAGFATKISAQESDVEIKTSYIYTNDSIAGFDEQAASAAAIENAIYGQEFKYFMYEEKRKFVIQKYNIKSPVQKVSSIVPFPAKYGAPSGIPNKSMFTLPSSGACTNDDFEDAQSNPGPQIGGVVNGWSLFGGVGSGPSNFCTPSATGATGQYVVYNAPTIDAIMIAPNNTVSSYFDATSITQPAGNCFIKLQDATAGASVTRLSKTYTISPTNALFRYAYRAVISNPAHSCCSQPGFKIGISITNTATGTSTVLTCPNITVAAGSSCGTAATGFSVGNLLNGAPSAYNASWVPGAIDLSPYLGNAVTLNVFAIDCNLSGHAGYVYFDALCAPMTIVGNGSGFPAGTPNITLPTCGAAGATITAPPGLGPYTWTSTAITVPGNLSVPNTTNTTLITNQSGTVALTMNPAGSCAPIIKIITVTITPAPQALITTTQAGCTNTTACVSLTTAGSASVTSNIIWTPSPGSLSSNSLLACTFPVGPGTVTVFDTFSCQVTNTFNINSAPPVPTFTLNANTFSITCTTPTANLNVTTNYTFGPSNFSWINSPPTFTSNATSISLSNGQTGNYTVSLNDPTTGCTVSQTFAIGQNTVAPPTTVTPISQVINCNAGAATFTSITTSSLTNITTYWFCPGATYSTGPSSQNSGTISISGCGNPGTSTVLTVNNTNGCSTTKTVQITSTSAFPTFNPTSTTNFTLGCASPVSTTTLCMANATSTNGPVQYAFMAPGSTATVPLSAGLFGASSCTTTGVAGTWTLVVLDPISLCQTPIPVVILSNTVLPNVSASMLTQTLTCNNPTVDAVGNSTTPNVNVSWLIPAPPNSLPTPSIVIGTPTGPNTNTALPNAYAIYTVVATNTVSQCKSTQTVQIYQNFSPPRNIGIGVSSPSFITCQNQCVTLSFTNAALSTSVSIPSNTWTTPAPAFVKSTLSSISACEVGTYSIAIKDSQNGCVTNTVINVLDQTNKPVLANIPTFTLDCAATSSLGASKITIALTGTLSNWSILLLSVPVASTGLSNPNLTNPPNGMTVTPAGANTVTFTVDQQGEYAFQVKNLATGCTETAEFDVIPGGLTADFSPSALTGYAPLSVNFTNLSSSSSTATGTSSITTNWSFGNGSVQTTTSAAIATTANYVNPGTYTVTIVSKKGGCVDSAYKVIRVDIPSKLEIPNVFTPNGDGSNDVFFLKTSNLTEITALIFDRWGNKVYELTSGTGNIAWDGKTLEGKDSPAGTYFYIIKATGKDGTTYDKKGNVSLYR